MTDIGLSAVGSIRTPFGVVLLTPQDRILLLASSLEPLRFRDVSVHLWALLERRAETWVVSALVEPLLQLIDGSGETSALADESISADLMKSVASLAGEW